MSKIEPRVLRGFRDYLPEEMIPRQRMLAAIERGFQRFGFAPLQTPALEYLDILMGKYGEEGSKLLYHFRDEGDREVALRYDLADRKSRPAAPTQRWLAGAATLQAPSFPPEGLPWSPRMTGLQGNHLRPVKLHGAFGEICRNAAAGGP